MAEIFISYAHKDQKSGIVVGNILREMGWQIWQDIHNLRPLGKFTEEISKGIRECSVFLVLYSSSYIESPYCQQEYAYAADTLGKNMACIILDANCPWRDTRFGFDFAGLDLPGLGLNKGANSEEDLRKLCIEVLRSEEFVALRQYLIDGNTAPMQRISFSNRFKVRLKDSFEKTQARIGNYQNGKEYDARLALRFAREDYSTQESDGENEYQKTIKGSRKLALPELIPTGKAARIVLSGSGGLGKTTSILKYGRMLLDKQPVICVRLADVQFGTESSYRQYNHIESYIHDHVCVTDPVWEYILKVGNRSEGEGFRLTLLLDGLNEVPGLYAQTALNEINRIAKTWSFTDLIVTTRSIQRIHHGTLDDFVFYSAVPPKPSFVSQYLQDNGISVDSNKASRMIELLRNPLRLTMFVKTQPYYSMYIAQKGLAPLLHEEQDTAGKIYDNYLASQLYAFLNTCIAAEENKSQITAFILCEIILPFIGWKLYSENRFTLAEREMRDLLRNADAQLSHYWDGYFKDRVEDLLYDYGFVTDYEWRPRDAANILDALDLMPHVKGDSVNDIYIFGHQSFRDYFAARFVSLEINHCLGEKPSVIEPGHLTLSQNDLSDDIVEMLSDINEEERAMPVCITDEGWRFPGKEKNSLSASAFSRAEQMLDLLRGKNDQATRKTVSNLFRILRYARKDLLGQCCFDRLDLRDCNLRNAEFALWYRQDLHPSSFDGAWIDFSCFSCTSHRAAVTALCPTEDGMLLSGDAGGLVLEMDCATGKMSGRRWTITNAPIRAIAYDSKTKCAAVADNHYLYSLSLRDDTCVMVFHERNRYIQKVRFNKSAEMQYCTDLEPMVWRDLNGCIAEDEFDVSWFSGAYDFNNYGDFYWRSGIMRQIYTGSRNSQGEWTEQGRWVFDMLPAHISACAHVAKPLRNLDMHFPRTKNERAKGLLQLEREVWRTAGADPEIGDFKTRLKQYLSLSQDEAETADGHKLASELQNSIGVFLSEAPDESGKRITSIVISPNGDRVLVSSGTMVIEFDTQTMKMRNRVRLAGTVNCVNYVCGNYGKAYAVAGWHINVSVLDSELNIISTCEGEPATRKVSVLSNREGTLFLLCSDSVMRRLDNDLRVSRIRRNIPHGMRKYLDATNKNGILIAYPLLSTRWKSGAIYNFDDDDYRPLTDEYYQEPRDERKVYLRLKSRKKIAYFMDRVMRVVSSDSPNHGIDFPYRSGIFVFGCSFRNLNGNITEEEKSILYMNGGEIE